uniref:(northern house mosquito) hypothetical protein n=1 Tax=Culex pipiens TaxID=7175 RepID=A0A8D8ANK9_CULPI
MAGRGTSHGTDRRGCGTFLVHSEVILEVQFRQRRSLALFRQLFARNRLDRRRYWFVLFLVHHNVVVVGCVCRRCSCRCNDTMLRRFQAVAIHHTAAVLFNDVRIVACIVVTVIVVDAIAISFHVFNGLEVVLMSSHRCKTWR